MIGTPVIIKHQNVTKKNADKLRCGTISDAYFNEPDGWYYCEGIIWDEDAQELIENQKWSVSCSYDFLSYNDEGGVENNIPYDKEFTDLNFTHLAIVDNPRYERANIVFNCKVENEKWITIKPHGDDSDDYRRLKLEDGETPKEAIERQYGNGGQLALGFSGAKKAQKDAKSYENKKIASRDKLYSVYLNDDVKEYGKKLVEALKEYNKYNDDGVNLDNIDDFVEKYEEQRDEEKAKTEYKKYVKEQFQKQSDTKDERIEARRKHQEVVKKHNQAYKDFEDGKISMEELEKVDAELEKSNKEFYGQSDIKDKQPDTKDKQSDSKDDEPINVTEDYYNRISKEELQKEFKDIQKEFAKWKDKKNFPEYKGYRNKLLKIKDIYEKRFGKNKADNSKEQDMALLEEIKKLISKVENSKENDMEIDEKIENETVDKRKLIDEVAGIMKSAGCDDEDIRTAIAKMEKIGYDKSEAGSADNKKVKNEEPDEKDDKKVENEDEKDKEEVKDLKDDLKEDVDNKCKNSKEMSTFDKINAIYNSIKIVAEESKYVSRQDKLDAAKEYFTK